MIISLIVAVAKNNIIGNNNQLVWHLPADLKHFKNLTMGHHVIMGRKTFDSIGKPLPGRAFIIITNNKNFKAEGCAVVHSLNEALLCAQNNKETEVFIIGGAEIFNLAMDKITTIYLTKIHQDFEGDTIFQSINKKHWQEVARQDFEPDEKNKYHYSFYKLEKTTH